MMLFIRLIENSLEACVLIVAVLIVTFLLRHAPKIYSYILWIMVFFWMLVPVRIPTPVGILPEISLEGMLDAGTSGSLGRGETAEGDADSMDDVGNTGDMDNPQRKEDALQNGKGSAQKENALQNGKGSAQKENVPQNGEGSARKESAPQNEEGISSALQVGDGEGRDGASGTVQSFWSAIGQWILPRRTVTCILWAIWLLGVIVMGGYGIWGAIRLRRFLRLAVRREQFGVKNVYQCDGIGTPIVYGIFRPRIYLPDLSLEPYQQQYILEHERMHIRRGDSFIKAVSYGLLCLHWFNPLVWWAFAQLERSMEFSCDEAVMQRLGDEQKKAYSRTLLTMAAGGSLQNKKGVLALGFLEKNTKKRVRNVLEYERRGRWITTAVSMVLIGCFLCILGGRGRLLAGNGWGSSVATQERHQKDRMESHKEKDDEREKGSGLPVIVVNGDGHIIGTRRGEELTHVVLSHVNNIKNGVSDRSKREEGYRIEDSAFSKCSNMKRLVVINSMDVTYVAEDAFQGCPSDLEVYCNRDTYLWKRLPKLGIKRREYREDDYKAAMLVGEERAEAIEQKAFAPLSEEMKESMKKDFGGLVMSLEVYENLSREEIREYEGTPYFIMTEAGRLLDIGGSVRIEAQTLGESVEYPSEARVIGLLFKDAYEMAQTKIPAWIEEIDDGAYNGSGLRKIEFETENGKSQLKKINVGAFLFCNFADSPKLVIPEGVTEIGAGAFQSCTGLEEIVLPKSLKKIGGDCFSGCTSLKKVTVKSPDVVFDGKNESKTTDGIFTLCGVEFIEETGEFTESEMVLRGPEDSTAQRYAAEHGIRFRRQLR